MEVVLWILAWYLAMGAWFALVIRGWRVAEIPVWVIMLTWPWFFVAD